VDNDDYGRINQFKWYAKYNKHTDGYYAVRNVRKANGKQTKQLMHRFIMNCPTDKQIDHRNHDTLDNRKYNLRIVTNSQNQWNTKCRKKAASCYKGVYLMKRKYKNTIYMYWGAEIGINGKRAYLGCFENEVDAALAYNEKAKELYAEHAFLNKIQDIDKKN